MNLPMPSPDAIAVAHSLPGLPTRVSAADLLAEVGIPLSSLDGILRELDRHGILVYAAGPPHGLLLAVDRDGLAAIRRAMPGDPPDLPTARELVTRAQARTRKPRRPAMPPSARTTGRRGRPAGPRGFARIRAGRNAILSVADLVASGVCLGGRGVLVEAWPHTASIAILPAADGRRSHATTPVGASSVRVVVAHALNLLGRRDAAGAVPIEVGDGYILIQFAAAAGEAA